MAIGQSMAGGIRGAAAPVAAAPAAPGEDAYAQIEKLHKLLTIGAITQDEFDAKKAELLSRIR